MSTVWMNLTLMGSSSTRRIRLDMNASVSPAYRFLAISATPLLGFQALQQVVRHMQAAPSPSQAQAGLVPAVVVAATGDDHAEPRGEGQEVFLLAGAELTVVALQALQALALELGHGLVPAAGPAAAEPARVRDHGHAARLPDPAGGLCRVQFFPGDEPRAVVTNEPFEGLGGPADEPLSREGLGEMDPGEQGGICLGLHLLQGDGAAELREPS